MQGTLPEGRGYQGTAEVAILSKLFNLIRAPHGNSAESSGKSVGGDDEGVARDVPVFAQAFEQPQAIPRSPDAVGDGP